jgi:hypothetical protein
MPFAYTKIDAVYVWTHDDYPIFIQVADRDVDQWTAFFDEFGIPSRIEERPDATDYDATVSYVLFPTSGSTAIWSFRWMRQSSTCWSTG